MKTATKPRHLRAVQPEEGCTHTYTSPCGRLWACISKAHPATPGQHYMKVVQPR